MEETKIVLNVHNNVTFIDGAIERDLYKGLKQVLGYTPAEAAFMAAAVEKRGDHKPWMSDWDGLISTICFNRKYCKCSIPKDGTHFPTGLLIKAANYLSAQDVHYTLVDHRPVYPKGTLNLEMTENFETRPYQQKLVDLVCAKDRGIEQAPTGSGKTAMAAKIIQTISVSPTIFFVPSKGLLNQTKAEFENFLMQNGIPIEVGVVGDGKCEIKDVTVMTIQTAVKSLGGVFANIDDEGDRSREKVEPERYAFIRELIQTCKLCIADEIQNWASSTAQIISDNLVNARYKFGISATPFRDKGDDILIEGAFGRIIASIDSSFLIDQGDLVQPFIYFVPINNDGLSCSSYPMIYKKAITENAYRNNMIANFANRLRSEGHSVLILCKQIAHGKALVRLIDDSLFLSGKDSTKKREAHLDKIRAGDNSMVTIATSIFDEGVDAKPLSALILAGSGKSCTRALQRVGRVIRPYTYDNGKVKEKAIVIDFFDDIKHLVAHSRKRMAIYRKEKKFVVKMLSK